MSTHGLEPSSSRTAAPHGDVCYRNSFPGIGELAMRPLQNPGDIPVVHRWVSQDYARYWGMNGLDVEGVAQAYRTITEPDHMDAYLGLHDGLPAFLVETYLPIHEPIATHYDALPTDRGMHVLVAPPTQPLPGFTFAVFSLIMDFLFDDPDAERVVVEPDVENVKIHALNYRAGFSVCTTVDLPATPAVPAKRALLSMCDRAAYAEARRAAFRRA